MHFENHQQAIVMLEQYQEHEGLFFTEEGIIVDSASKQPIISISKVIASKRYMVSIAQLDNNVISFHGQHALSSQELQDLGWEIVPVKSFLALSEPLIQSRIVRAFHWLNWDINSQFCGKCGSKLQAEFNSVEKRCNHCGLSIFPKASPAVMVLIYRENELLLARSWHFKPGMFSAIAGFIELGESAEIAAHREVKEELGIEITDLEYFGSQTWPFPDSFMIAFKARYLKGELALDTSEIEAAHWYNKHSLPTLPPSASISRKLIESVLLTL